MTIGIAEEISNMIEIDMTNTKADAVRIQTSVLNALEKKVLVWLAERQPKWMTSDILTYFGTFGAVLIAVGYILTPWNQNFLWLSSLGNRCDKLLLTTLRIHSLQRLNLDTVVALGKFGEMVDCVRFVILNANHSLLDRYRLHQNRNADEQLLATLEHCAIV